MEVMESINHAKLLSRQFGVISRNRQTGCEFHQATYTKWSKDKYAFQQDAYRPPVDRLSSGGGGVSASSWHCGKADTRR